MRGLYHAVQQLQASYCGNIPWQFPVCNAGNADKGSRPAHNENFNAKVY